LNFVISYGLLPVPSFSKSVRAAMDLIRLVSLPIGSKETKGDLRIPLKGQIEFRQVDFTYPSRPDFPVLKGVSFVIQPGECVGIVG
jgi:ATP-binding cassette subfamily B (MDR/TAP) protein 1